MIDVSSPFRLTVDNRSYGIEVTLPGLQPTVVPMTPAQLHTLARAIYAKVFS